MPLASKTYEQLTPLAKTNYWVIQEQLPLTRANIFSSFNKVENFFLKKSPLNSPLAIKTYKQLTPHARTSCHVIQGEFIHP